MSDWRFTVFRADEPADRVASLSLVLADELTSTQVEDRARTLARQLYGDAVEVGDVEPESWSPGAARRPRAT